MKGRNKKRQERQEARERTQSSEPGIFIWMDAEFIMEGRGRFFSSEAKVREKNKNNRTEENLIEFFRFLEKNYVIKLFLEVT